MLARTYLDTLNSPVMLQNLGVSGIQIDQLYNGELRGAITSSTTLVTLYIGTNDICEGYSQDPGGSIGGFESLYTSTVNVIINAASPQLQLYLLTVPNQAVVQGTRTCSNTNLAGDTQTIDAFIKSLASSTAGVSGYVDLFNEYNAPTNYLSSDGTDPNATGYQHLALLVQQAIAAHNPLLNSNRVHPLSLRVGR